MMRASIAAASIEVTRRSNARRTASARLSPQPLATVRRDARQEMVGQSNRDLSAQTHYLDAYHSWSPLALSGCLDHPAYSDVGSEGKGVVRFRSAAGCETICGADSFHLIG
jgi:hypothetical protein